MLYLIALFFALTIASLTMLVAQLIPSRDRAIADQLAEVQLLSNPFAVRRVRARQEWRTRIEGLLQELGNRFEQKAEMMSQTQALLIQAGFRSPNALPIYRGIRLVAPVVAFLLMVLLFSGKGAGALVFGLGLAGWAWTMPSFYLGSKRKARQRQLQRALPDMLDSLVVCVEAGLGLNQAMHRVADEIRHISLLMAEELSQTNLEIRAGVPRDDAMRNFAHRTGLSDVRSLATMLIQAERFGTSIATALRVHSDTLREKRRQRAEEIVNKMAIKLLFPLVFCIFPALFVMALGPALIQLSEAWKSSPL